MVDVSGKEVTKRVATASASVQLSQAHLNAIANHPKGDVFAVAKIAGIQAAKKTGELIPLCHPIFLANVSIEIEIKENLILISATAIAEAKTGVEMEALTAASVAALTIYDMLKAVGPEIVIQSIQLIEKTGGKSDFRR